MDLCCTLAKWQQCWLCPVHLPSEWWRWLLCCMLAFSWMALCCVLSDGNALTPLLYTCHLSDGIDLMTLCWTFAEWWHWWLYVVVYTCFLNDIDGSVVYLPSEWQHNCSVTSFLSDWLFEGSCVVHFASKVTTLTVLCCTLLCTCFLSDIVIHKKCSLPVQRILYLMYAVCTPQARLKLFLSNKIHYT